MITKLLLASILGGLAAGAFGVGPGLIFNPIMIAIGLHPAAASATGMYMVIYSTCAASIVAIIMGNVEPIYTIVIMVMTIIGSYPGIMIQTYLGNKGRESATVAILLFVIVFCLISIPAISFTYLDHKIEEGQEVWASR
mmetsp:Transcript_18582/g.25688  ORF Transcript_18582/g.25688 Transcript_18582/m.25688 type:complete len:139 (+) Transcript_18582:302-718(+)